MQTIEMQKDDEEILVPIKRKDWKRILDCLMKSSKMTYQFVEELRRKTEN